MDECKPLVEGVLWGNCTDGYVDKNPGREMPVDPRMTPGSGSTWG